MEEALDLRTAEAKDKAPTPTSRVISPSSLSSLSNAAYGLPEAWAAPPTGADGVGVVGGADSVVGDAALLDSAGAFDRFLFRFDCQAAVRFALACSGSCVTT